MRQLLLYLPLSVGTAVVKITAELMLTAVPKSDK
jgi:hypothetical protein